VRVDPPESATAQSPYREKVSFPVGRLEITDLT
jgi:hypothetical protein